MVTVQASEQEVSALIAGQENCVGIAALNGPMSVVVSGDADAVQKIAVQFESMGRTATHYIDLNEIASSLPVKLAPNLPRKLWNKVTLELSSLPYLLGLKQPCQDFRNVEIVDAPES